MKEPDRTFGSSAHPRGSYRVVCVARFFVFSILNNEFILYVKEKDQRLSPKHPEHHAGNGVSNVAHNLIRIDPKKRCFDPKIARSKISIAGGSGILYAGVVLYDMCVCGRDTRRTSSGNENSNGSPRDVRLGVDSV
jgi:hypothetical protein